MAKQIWIRLPWNRTENIFMIICKNEFLIFAKLNEASMYFCATAEKVALNFPLFSDSFFSKLAFLSVNFCVRSLPVYCVVIFKILEYVGWR